MMNPLDNRPGSKGSRTLPRVLLGLLALSCVGIASELLLLDHYEGWRQWIPLAALTAIFANSIAVLATPSSPLLGVYFHVKGNLEFELELHPTVKGWEKIWNVMKGAFPALAPLSMAQLGLLGLIAARAHPSFRRPRPANIQNEERGSS
jgi:hypothetical protein